MNSDEMWDEYLSFLSSTHKLWYILLIPILEAQV